MKKIYDKIKKIKIKTKPETMNYENKQELDIQAIQEKNLEILQESQTTVSEELLGASYVEAEILDNASRVVDTQEIPKEKELEDVLVFLEEGEWENSEKEIGGLVQSIDTTILAKCYRAGVFVTKYILTASFIFVILMAFTNYSAYITIAKSYFNPEAILQSEKDLQMSLDVSQIRSPIKAKQKTDAEIIQEQEARIYNSKNIKSIIGNIRDEEIDLNIEIIPFVNRVVIPKIGKNIPLVDIEEWKVEWLDELNDIFMEELSWGVVRYPGSAKPWQFGNAFIFWHSSNFPWVQWEYNDVFVLLDKLEIWDEVVSYYEWQKYTYKITEKRVIHPSDVEVLKRDTGKKEITLMTCWPIGTTYNRLLVIWELVK